MGVGQNYKCTSGKTSEGLTGTCLMASVSWVWIIFIICVLFAISSDATRAVPPSRQLTYPMMGKGKSSSKVPNGRGCVGSLDGKLEKSSGQVMPGPLVDLRFDDAHVACWYTFLGPQVVVTDAIPCWFFIFCAIRVSFQTVKIEDVFHPKIHFNASLTSSEGENQMFRTSAATVSTSHYFLLSGCPCQQHPLP